ncbi:hypothetical protein D1007_13008 [Hordeum vulgare]|nr:hypothetical protein D1007_13008 [Hordeum vulgare]
MSARAKGTLAATGLGMERWLRQSWVSAWVEQQRAAKAWEAPGMLQLCHRSWEAWLQSISIEGTYDRYQGFAGAGKDLNERGASSNNDGDPSNIQSKLKDIASWSLRNNADDSDANELEKLEKLLTDALKNTKSKKNCVMLMLTYQSVASLHNTGYTLLSEKSVYVDAPYIA